MKIPSRMRAVAIESPGAASVLHVVERAVPRPRRGEVLVRVHAAGVNRPDVLQRQGKYPLPPDADPLPGLEIAGEVVASAAPGAAVAVGARVMALAHGGGYAEYCRVPASHCLPVPDSLGFVEAAAVPETFFTVWYNVFRRAALATGEWLLVHGGSSGIGSTAIQLAVARGARVIVTAGSDEKCRFCESLGAVAINYRDTDWAAAVMQHTENRGVDVVLDMVAGRYVQQNIDVLARDGRYAIIAFLDGPRAELDLRRIVTQRLTITGSTLRPQTIAEKAAIAADLRTNVLPLLESGAIRPIVFKTYPLADARDAHLLMESSAHMGKIVLHVSKGQTP